jgi:hypothetical protein
MTTRGEINSNFYQIVNVDGNGAPTDVKPEYLPNVGNANYATNANYANFSGNAFNVTGSNVSGDVAGANHANIADVANSVAGANVSGTVANANYAAYAGNITINAQPNITSTGTLTSLTSNGIINFANTSNVTLGDVSNLHISGGTANYVLSTNGSGNLNWVAQTGGGGGTPGGSNTYVQFNDGGTFGGVAQLTFNKTTNTLTTTNFSGNGALLTNLTGSNVVGDVSGANHANVADVANSVAGANVSGQVANALVAGTVYTNAQPNITSTGTLTSLSVTGNITGFANITGDYILGNGAFLTGVGNFSAALGYHGSFFSNVNQTIASTTTAYPITLNNTSAGTYGVAITSNSRVTMTYAGTYNIQYSIQFTNTDNNIHNATVWLRKNGTDVPDTNSVYAVTARHGGTNGQLIGAINYIVDANANDYYELIWQAESTSISLEYIGPGTTPTSPATPSVIVTAMQVTNVQAATLSGNLTGDLIGNSYGLTGTSFINIIGNISGNVFTGNGSGLTNLTGANVTGTVANATHATTANTVVDNAQPNITSTGTLISLGVTGNITAGNINGGNLVTSNFFSGNGSLLTGVTATATPGGSNSQVQFNNAGVLYGSARFVYNDSTTQPSITLEPNTGLIGAVRTPQINFTTGSGTGNIGRSNATGGTNSLFLNDANAITITAPTVNLGSNSNVKITGGSSSQVLSTDGLGNLSWVTGGGGGGNANIAGSNTEVFFNNNGSNTLGTSVNLTFNTATNVLATTNLAITGTANIANLTTNKYSENVQAGGSVSGTITPNVAAGTIFNYTLTGNITFNALGNAVAGSGCTVILTQDATGNRTLTSTMKFLGGVKTLSTAANAIDIVSVFYDGTTYYASLGKGFA